MNFNVRIHYHDKAEETKTMLTGELYKFITEFNRTNKIGWIVLSKIGQSTITAQNGSLESKELSGMSNPKVSADAGKEQEAVAICIHCGDIIEKPLCRNCEIALTLPDNEY